MRFCLLVTWARIFKLVRGPGLETKKSIPPAYVDWRAGTITLFLYSVPSLYRLFKNSSTVLLHRTHARDLFTPQDTLLWPVYSTGHTLVTCLLHRTHSRGLFTPQATRSWPVYSTGHTLVTCLLHRTHSHESCLQFPQWFFTALQNIGPHC